MTPQQKTALRNPLYKIATCWTEEDKAIIFNHIRKNWVYCRTIAADQKSAEICGRMTNGTARLGNKPKNFIEAKYAIGWSSTEGALF